MNFVVRGADGRIYYRCPSAQHADSYLQSIGYQLAHVNLDVDPPTATWVPVGVPKVEQMYVHAEMELKG